MHSKSILKAVMMAAIAFNGAHASPMVSKITARNTTVAESDGGFFLCTDAEFQGQCNNFGFFVGECVNLADPFQDSVSSLGPDQGFICDVFINSKCSGGTIIVEFPGISDLSATGFNDKISSFKCFRN